MNKKIIIIITLAIVIVGGTFTANILKKTDLKVELNNTGSKKQETNSGGIIKDSTKDISIIEKKDKIGELRKKLELKGLILKGDINLQNGDYTSALIKYIQINKELPNDKSIIQKLGDVYYNMKKFDKAYSFYSQIKGYEKLDKNLVAKTLISSVTFSDENIKYLINELNTLGLNEEQLFYYKTSLECKVDFSECRKEYQDYFKNRLEQSNIDSTGAISDEIKFVELSKIKKSIENYENFQLEDLNYKGALIAGAFFENGLYPIAIETSKSILNDKNDYKPILKIIAKSYFELGNYVQAKLYLIEYSNIVSNDEEVSFFLGVVYERLHEYVLSTIHLNKAIDLGYNDTLDLYKRILYNYYQLGEIDKMLETFKSMINNHKDKLSLDDYNLAIYYNIVNDNIKDAKNYTELALKKYPESEIFYGYMGWILMDEINKKPLPKSVNISGTGSNNNEKLFSKLYSESEKYIDKGLELNSKSPMLNFVKGKMEMSKGDYKKAFLYITKTISIDGDGEFGTMAKKELKNIQINK